MAAILTYVFQVNLLLSLLFLGYHFLLRGLTFYELNRVYLVLGAVYAFVYPFLDINSWFAKTIPLVEGEVLAYFPVIPPASPEFGLHHYLVWLMGAGGAIFLLILLIRLASLVRIHNHSKEAIWQNYLYRNVLFPIRPFSFFNRIYLHRQQHVDSELPDIFKHEYIHVKGLHSIDVIVFEMITVVCWYNPLIWLLRRAVRQNLEFLTDQQVLKQGVDRQHYQYSLVQTGQPQGGSSIGTQFNFNYLKKRIMMMNKKRSSRLQMGRYAFLLPALLLAGITLTVNQANAKIEDVVLKLRESSLDQQLRAVSEKDAITEGAGESAPDTSTIGSVKKVQSRKHADASSIIGKAADNQEASPLMIVDGEKMPSEFDVKSIDPNTIESMSILKNATSIKLYGSEGKNGVILIELKENAKNPIKKTSKQDGSPLVIVDGEEMPSGFDPNSVDPNTIDSIKVLKDAHAFPYGEAGRDGVLLIALKGKSVSENQDTASEKQGD
ncbi:MAG: M56 family metallopeptidase [Sphingobacterium sp.]